MVGFTCCLYLILKLNTLDSGSTNSGHYLNFMITKILWIAVLPVCYCHKIIYPENSTAPSCSKLATLLVNVLLNFQNLISQICMYFLLKLENCVCKTQVMPLCPKPVLTLCPILTHDPQHIQSILETNV